MSSTVSYDNRFSRDRRYRLRTNHVRWVVPDARQHRRSSRLYVDRRVQITRRHRCSGKSPALHGLPPRSPSLLPSARAGRASVLQRSNLWRAREEVCVTTAHSAAGVLPPPTRPPPPAAFLGISSAYVEERAREVGAVGVAGIGHMIGGGPHRSKERQRSPRRPCRALHDPHELPALGHGRAAL